MSRVKILLVTLRLLAIAALFLAWYNPNFSFFSDTNNIRVLVDVSDSMTSESVEAVIERIKRSPLKDTASLVAFAGSPAPYADSLNHFSSFRTLQSSWGSLDIGATNLERALRSLKENGPVLLISDGFEHGGDVLGALSQVKNQNTHLYPLLPEQAFSEPASFHIVQLFAPLTAPLHTSVPIRVGIQNSTMTSQGGLLTIFHGGKELYHEKVSLDAGKEKLITVDSDGSLTGVQEIKAVLIPDASQLGQSSDVTFLSGAQRQKVLLVSGSSDDHRFLKQALAEQSYQVEEKIASEAVIAISNANEYGVIIFNNVSIKQLSAEVPATIKEYVSAGGAFLMIGGAKSFGLGGYRDTPVEQVLPVLVVPPETEQKRINVGVSLVLDKSQSMAENQKIEFVKEAAKQVVKSLKDDDYLSIIGFDQKPFVALPSSRLSAVRDLAVNQIGNLFPTGSTRLFPALQTAVQELERTPAGRKHIIVLTDGRLPDAGPMYVESAKQLRIEGITLSTILLGDESNFYPLKEMAESGGGAFYQTTDPNILPKVFINDIKVSTGEKTLKEETMYDVRKGPAGIVSTTLQSFPPLRGYVQTRIKDSAKLELIAYTTQMAEPLFASWNYGKGRSAAFTSDANGRWSSEWVSWVKFRQFWTEILQSLSEGKNGNQAIQFELRPFVERGQVKLDLSIFSSGVGGSIAASIKYPDGHEHTQPFEALSEGHYELSIDKPTAGKYETVISVGSKKLTPVTFNISGESFGEQKGRGFNAAILEKIARETGGKVNPDLSTLSSEKVKSITHFDWVFLLLAMAFLCAEIYIREMRKVFVR